MLKTKSTNIPFSLVVSSWMLKRTACCQEVAATYRTVREQADVVVLQLNAISGNMAALRIVTDFD
jgi:hypothetical protein